jgi:hypothetical protein
VKFVGTVIFAVALALGIARLFRAKTKPKAQRDRVRRAFHEIAKRADPVALEDFRFARRQLTKESKD